MVEPHSTPTSFKDPKSPILDAAFSAIDEVAKTRELFGEMKQPLHKLNVHSSHTPLHYFEIKNVLQDVFDGLHDRTMQMASLAGSVGTKPEITEYVLERS